MGWSELRRIPNEYNDAVAEIDETIIELISSRRELTKNGRFFPPAEMIAKWSAEYEMEESQIQMILRQLQEPNQLRHAWPDQPGLLRTVVPIMKKAVVGSCEYSLTHVMQHELASIVFVDIRYLSEEDQHGLHLKPNLMLEVIGDQPYGVRRQGVRGGGSHTEMQFLVSPPLPDSLERVAFSLVPSAMFLERKIREVTLDQQVDFE